jgi:hypothetical protein
MGSAHNLKLDQTVSLDVILGPQGLIDVELNGERCVVTRGTKDLSHNRLFLFSEGGNIVFDQIEVRPWESFTTLEKANTK